MLLPPKRKTHRADRVRVWMDDLVMCETSHQTCMTFDVNQKTGKHRHVATTLRMRKTKYICSVA
jgi:hypothetical protein